VLVSPGYLSSPAKVKKIFGVLLFWVYKSVFQHPFPATLRRGSPKFST
jgi:hypothetical protein